MRFCLQLFAPASSSRCGGVFWLAHASAASRAGFASESLESSAEMAGNDAFANESALFSFPMAGNDGFANSRSAEMASYAAFAQHEKRPKAIWLCKTVIARHRGAYFGPIICRTVVRCHFGSVSTPIVCKPGVRCQGYRRPAATEVSTKFQANRPRAHFRPNFSRAIPPERLTCLSSSEHAGPIGEVAHDAHVDEARVPRDGGRGVEAGLVQLEGAPTARAQCPRAP